MRRRRLRVPVVLQNSSADCGLACVTMILRYHGCGTTLREVSRRTGVGRDGVNALELVHVAREFGLNAQAFSVGPERLASVPGPALVHWDFGHFIVLERWSPDRAVIVDPSRGRRTLSVEEFDAGFTGVVIVFEPGPSFDPRSSGESGPRWPGRSLVSSILRHRALGAQILVASLVLQLLGMVVPAATAFIVDDVLPQHNGTVLGLLGVGMLLVALCQLVLSLLRSSVLISLRARADAELTNGLVDHLLRLPYRFFVDRGSTDVVMRTAGISIIREIVTRSVLPAVLDGPFAVGYLSVVLIRDPFIGGFLAAVGALQIGILLRSRRRVAELAERELFAEADAQGYLIETIQGIETLKATGAERRAAKQWSDRFVAKLNTSTRYGQAAGLLDSVLNSVRSLASMGLVWVGAWRVVNGALTLGTMLGLIALAMAGLAPLISVASSVQSWQVVRAHLDRLLDILEAEAEPEPPGPDGNAPPPLEMAGAIELVGVGFRYDPRAQWIIRNVSFAVEPGQKVALVGPSGSGKSTLARILLSLYPPTEGQVRHDGVPTAGRDLRALRSQLGVVTQEPSLFSGTIRENISLGKPDAALDEVVEAACLACIHDEIMQFPMRYETMLTEGNGLSGGQRQRLALARALLTRPKVLLLDEATSHLDTVTEARIEQNLAALTQTRIVIAHRLSTVQNADVILVLDQGTIADQGTHDELLTREGFYARASAPPGTA